MLGSADAFVGWMPDGLLHRSVLLSLFVQSNLSLIHSRVYPPYFRRRSGKRCDANPIQYAWQIRRSRCNALLRKGVRWHHPKRSRFRVVVQQVAHVREEDLVQSANDFVEDCTFAVQFHRDYVCCCNGSLVARLGGCHRLPWSFKLRRAQEHLELRLE